MTTLATVLFFVGTIAGVLMPDYRLWLQVPAALILMAWYAAMASKYEQARRDHTAHQHPRG